MVLRGLAIRIPSHDTSGIRHPAPSTQAARSPRRIASAHADRNTADPPAPAIQTVKRPRGSPPPGNTRSSAATPVATWGTVRSGGGTALGNRASMIRRSSAMAVMRSFCHGVVASVTRISHVGTKPPGRRAPGAQPDDNRRNTESQAGKYWEIAGRSPVDSRGRDPGSHSWSHPGMGSEGCPGDMSGACSSSGSERISP